MRHALASALRALAARLDPPTVDTTRIMQLGEPVKVTYNNMLVSDVDVAAAVRRLIKVHDVS